MEVFLIMGIAGIIILTIVTLIILPNQIKYVEELERIRNRSGKKQGDLYENMTFEEQVLHANAQGSILFIPANIIAHIIHKKRKKKEDK